jgi:hypothetical protein
VVTQDGRKYQFDKFLTIVNDTIVIKPTQKDKMYSGSIDYVVTKGGTKYEFDKSPVIVNDSIVGEVVVYSFTMPEHSKQISIPLSDVAEISVSEFGISIWQILGVGVLGLLLISGLLFAWQG